MSTALHIPPRIYRYARKNKFSLKEVFYISVSVMIVWGLYSHFSDYLVDILVLHRVAIQAEEEQLQSPIKPVQPSRDQRILRLETFLRLKKSPLAPHAALIVDQADKYDIGWTKIVSIAGIESVYGIKCPQNSHNAWGLGGSKFMYFSSWEEGIKKASEILSDHYRTQEYAAIKAKYCPKSDGCNPQWTNIVLGNSEEILNND